MEWDNNTVIKNYNQNQNNINPIRIRLNLKRDIKENRQRINEFYETSHEKNSKETPNLHLEMASDDFAPESNRIEWKKPIERNSLFFNPTPIHPPSRKYHGSISTETKLIEGPIGKQKNEVSCPHLPSNRPPQ